MKHEEIKEEKMTTFCISDECKQRILQLEEENIILKKELSEKTTEIDVKTGQMEMLRMTTLQKIEENNEMKTKTEKKMKKMKKMEEEHQYNVKLTENLMEKSSNLSKIVSGFLSNSNDQYMELNDLKNIHFKMEKEMEIVCLKQKKLFGVINEKNVSIQTLSETINQKLSEIEGLEKEKKKEKEENQRE
eukprot:TRINITY_DN17869_c0_g1_i1.p1 TRINITY_DN17869_c0_g1~~TRINITY_DN17869_c0_g1_i1.p1  ORF type:complete len:189 (-),score=80.76 TRINITY_DN17869_c0_g1_i1:97-663(-)